jgi:hypothetical protein
MVGRACVVWALAHWRLNNFELCPGSAVVHVVAEAPPPPPVDVLATADNHNASAMADSERRRESAVYHFAHEFVQDDVPSGVVQFIWEARPFIIDPHSRARARTCAR